MTAYGKLTDTNTPRNRIFLLLAVVMVAGLSQGLLLPLLSLLLEQAGVSSDVNGMHSVALYLGVFSTMFFIEKPVLRYGYKPVILAGLLLITVATLSFAVSQSLYFWLVLRFMIGVGDSALHYATQLWIVSSAPADRRGRYISLYGMAYGVGFSLGPLGINLLQFGQAAPFLVSAALSGAVLLALLRLSNEAAPPALPSTNSENRYLRTYRLAWFALIPSLLYGLMEALMNSSFPLYGVRIALSEEWISLLLPCFGLGSLILQLPLGIWSDRIGRKPVLMLSGVLGGALFLLIPIAGNHVWILVGLFTVAGGFVGSFYSLGLAYAADILPREIVSSANVIASIHFSIGSILGPSLGGLGIQYVSPHSIFLFLGAVFLSFALLGIRFRGRSL